MRQILTARSIYRRVEVSSTLHCPKRCRIYPARRDQRLRWVKRLQNQYGALHRFYTRWAHSTQDSAFVATGTTSDHDRNTLTYTFTFWFTHMQPMSRPCKTGLCARKPMWVVRRLHRV